MGKFFASNIGTRGRIVRAMLATILIVLGIELCLTVVWAGVLLLASGAFVMFEALRGWCLARACGIKTKL
jgi:hypothetical protein